MMNKNKLQDTNYWPSLSITNMASQTRTFNRFNEPKALNSLLPDIDEE
jgi:hypothetical protein